MRHRAPLPSLIPLLLTLGLGACRAEQEAAPRQPAEPRPGRRVIATFEPLAFLVREMAPAGTSVTCLTPAGADPHDLELTPGDVTALLEVDLVVTLHGLQPAVDRVLARRLAPTFDALAVPDLGVLSTGTGAVDPHVWLDPLRFARVAWALGPLLGPDADPQATYSRLEALDRQLEAALGSCEHRRLVTAHAAFGYLCDRYGFEQVALGGFDPEGEPTPRDLARLVAEAKESGTGVVFGDRRTPSSVIETLAREAGAETALLHTLESLSAEEVAAGKDYYAVMRENLAVLVEVLECRQPSS
ncbi:MAG TPA: zinc ABC transporter substrate-binding protein [Thermoanaerobaculia bacterium]|nr:zinc ABC transporter substrate-binding protein [Thermoanaerobaculia bacterium]